MATATSTIARIQVMSDLAGITNPQFTVELPAGQSSGYATVKVGGKVVAYVNGSANASFHIQGPAGSPLVKAALAAQGGNGKVLTSKAGRTGVQVKAAQGAAGHAALLSYLQDLATPVPAPKPAGKPSKATAGKAAA